MIIGGVYVYFDKSEVGDRIGQLTLVKYNKAVFKEVLNFNFESLERVGGFGSTGK